MKNFTLLLLGAFLFSGVASAQQRFARTDSKVEKLQTKSVFAKDRKSITDAKKFPLTRSENAILKPQVESMYEYDEGEWLPYMDLHYKYDLKGNITEIFFDDGESQYKTVITYNENDNVLTKMSLVSEDKGKTWLNEEKNEYEYDDLVPDFKKRSTMYSWRDDKWEIGYSNIYDIARNEKGYVTRMAIQSYYQGAYEEIEAIEVVYENGELPAKTWKHFMLGYNDENELVMSEVVRYDNIKWENSDGQILSHDENDFLVGNNRIKEAKVYDEGVETAKLKVVYTNKRDFESTMSSVAGPDKIKHILKDTDENGSYKEQILESYDENGDGIMEEYVSTNEVTCDSHGNIVLFNVFEEMEGESEQVDGSKSDYKYGDNDEILEIINYAWNYDEQKFDPIEKIVPRDYIDVTQQTGITAQTQQGLKYSIENGRLLFSMNGANHYTIYNVSGMRIINENMANESESISISDLPGGLYLLVIEGSEGVTKIKFMKR